MKQIALKIHSDCVTFWHVSGGFCNGIKTSTSDICLPQKISADADAERRKKKKMRVVREEAGLPLGSQPNFAFENTDRMKQIAGIAQPDGSYTSKENFNNDVKEV